MWYVPMYPSTFPSTCQYAPIHTLCTFMHFFLFAAVLTQVNQALNQCVKGMDAVMKHEGELFARGLLPDNSSEGWPLLELEQTLFTLGSHKDLTKGVFYCLAIPANETCPAFVR